MADRTLLVIGSVHNRRLVDGLTRRGWNATVTQPMQPALTALRHRAFEAIVIDRRRIETDVLELILNIRDFDDQTPIVVVGPPNDIDSNRIVARQVRVRVVERRTPEAAAEELDRCTAMVEGESSPSTSEGQPS